MRSYAINLNRVLVVAVLFAAHGCGKETQLPQAPESKTSEAADSEATPSPQERALSARDALFQRLSSELMTAMSQGGPSAAIDVCSQTAPKIAEEVGREHGLSIGRTSFKLRNPQNQPPTWAVQLVEQRVQEPRFVKLDNQQTGAFLPIHLKAQCLVCHGPEEQIAEDVLQQLARRYPNDQATGFRDGDLRGWFWIEVPDRAVAIQ